MTNRSGYSVAIPKKNSNHYIIRIFPKYRTTSEQEKTLDVVANKIVQLTIKPEMTDFEKAVALYNYLIDNVKYSMETKGNMYTEYTALNENVGVCNAYVLAYSRLLDKANIPNMYVKGDATTGIGEVVFHAWNKIKIDGQWYNTDITWEDSNQLSKPGSTYRYFLKSDKFFYKDHKPMGLEKLPKSTDVTYDNKELGKTNVKVSIDIKHIKE